jgi:hypothetical protein
VSVLTYQINKTGVTRLVFPVGKYVIKIPNFLDNHKHFLVGCAANWGERRLWKSFKGVYATDEDVWDYWIPTLWCSWFGLISLQLKGSPLSDQDWGYVQEHSIYKEACSDFKRENFVKLDSKIYCCDYQ